VSLEALQALARLHGVAAWLATVTLIAAAWAQASGRARRLTVALGAAAATLALAAGGLGFALHDGYRARIRQKLFLQSATLGWLFERKQHLAFAAVLLAVAAAAITIATRRLEARPGAEAVTHELKRASTFAWSAAAVLALTASVTSVIVAGRMSF
jgi:adenylosuccinate lyase